MLPATIMAGMTLPLFTLALLRRGLGEKAKGSDANPSLSALERNLQRAHLDRLISLATTTSWPNASRNTVTSLARHELRALRDAIDKASGAGHDTTTTAHLVDALERIDAALEAIYVRQG